MSESSHFSKGSAVIVYLANPKERYWGMLIGHDETGISILGIDIASFDDWCRQVASADDRGFDLTTMFFPCTRLEKVLLDESNGSASMTSRFKDFTGQALKEHLEKN